MAILGIEIGKIITCLEQTFVEMKDILRAEGIEKSGGYFTLFDTAEADGKVIFSSEIGLCPGNKWVKYFTLSVEKARRLGLRFPHQSSWESRNEHEEQFGGAIRTRYHLILSFSGLPELTDEALMLHL